MSTSTLPAAQIDEAIDHKPEKGSEVVVQRDMLFISHANPEDNEFSQWLSLQLAKYGYPVWCDLTKLLGGEAFWTDIEQALRQKTAKFLYVLSRTSNAKDGPLNELQVAANIQRDNKLHDFVIPLLIDDLPHREINIQLSRLTAVNFREGWAKGLQNLLRKLQKDGLKQRPSFNPATVASWWKLQHGASQAIRNQSEEHLSNWFPLVMPPKIVLLHKVAGWPNNEKDGSALAGEWPAIRHEKYLVSFAGKKAFEGEYEIDRSVAYSAQSLLAGTIKDALIDRTQARNLTTFLLRDAWERAMRSRQLSEYKLANRKTSFWFHKNLIPDDTIYFVGIDGRRTSRQIVGFKTLKATKARLETKRHWHFAFEAKPFVYPFIGFSLKSHVLFTDDGFTLWDDKDRMHRARRSQCKLWWNPKWRDLLLATMSYLSDGAQTIHLNVAPEQSLEIGIWPLAFDAPVSFTDQPAPDETTAVLTDETEHEDNESEEDER